MAGPIPLLQDTHRQRNVSSHFEETTAVPPMDVDGLARAVRQPPRVRGTSLCHLYFLTFRLEEDRRMRQPESWRQVHAVHQRKRAMHLRVPGRGADDPHQLPWHASRRPFKCSYVLPLLFSFSTVMNCD